MIVVFDLDNTLVHSRIDFLGIRRAIIQRLQAAGALEAAPMDPRARSIPEWLELAEHHDRALAAELWRGLVDALKPSGAGVAAAHARLGGGPTFVVGDSYIDGLAAERAAVGARFVAFRASAADLAARGVRTWAAISALGELPGLLLGPAPR